MSGEKAASAARPSLAGSKIVVVFYGQDDRPLVTWTVDPAQGERQQVGLVPGVSYAEIRLNASVP